MTDGRNNKNEQNKNHGLYQPERRDGLWKATDYEK